MKKPNKKDNVNLFFSAFLVLAFIVCAHFFTQFTSTLTSNVGTIIGVALYVVFGLLLFYATRVGDGKAVKRFSIVTLIVMVLPALYIIIASMATGLPFHDVFASDYSGSVSLIVSLAGIALGYGIPYTFLSGFEIESDDETAEEVSDSSVLEGGIEADLLEDEAEESTESEEALDEEVSSEEESSVE
ncbi:MAG: hypothetical protein J1E85_06190 [Ruminococcus sp.]|nr:hypothetical protein [Ruminococcus sp.]